MDSLGSIQVNSVKRSAVSTQYSIKFLSILLFIVVLLLPLNAFALTIDEFSDEDSTTVRSEQIQVPDIENVAADVIGGNRMMYTVVKQGIDVANELSVNGGKLWHADGGGIGRSQITWDGDSDENLDPNGLGGIDLLQDITGDGEFILNVHSSDKKVKVTITVYYNSTEAASNEKMIPPVDYKPNGTLVKFLFKDFVNISGAEVDFSNIGAIVLDIDSQKSYTDFTVNALGTNGCNKEVPNDNTDSKDRCGVVCGNNDCVDCQDVPEGSALPGTECDTGLNGICAKGTWSDFQRDGGFDGNGNWLVPGPTVSCTCNQNEDPINEICDGLDNNCDGSVDEPFDKLGEDCSVGVDDCAINGVYECDDTGGVRCTADDRKDDADECDESRGCDGVPYSGLVLDDCGVCGGDGKSCADCEGVPNGPKKVDRCGICGGSGQSCVSCDEQNIKDIQTSLDSTVSKMEKWSKRLRNLIIKEAKAAFKDGEINSREKRKTIKFARQSYKENKVLADRAWQKVWTEIPSEFQTCSNSFCVSTSNAGPVNDFLSINEQIENINKAQANELKNLAATTGNKRSKRRATRLNRRTGNSSTQNEVNANSVPLTVSNCS